MRIGRSGDMKKGEVYGLVDDVTRNKKNFLYFYIFLMEYIMFGSVLT